MRDIPPDPVDPKIELEMQIAEDPTWDHLGDPVTDFEYANTIGGGLGRKPMALALTRLLAVLAFALLAGAVGFAVRGSSNNATHAPGMAAASLVGAAGAQSPTVPVGGPGASALAFNGSNDVVFPLSMAQTVGLTSGPYTVEFWASPAAAQNAFANILDTHGGTTGWTVEMNDTATNQYYWAAEPNYDQRSPMFTIPATGVHHVAIVYDAAGLGTLTIYVDGLRQASQTPYASPVTPTNPLHFGRWSQGGRNWSGVLSEVRISNIARYTGASFSVPNARFALDSNTLALWRLDEGAGATIHDAAGRGAPGILEGTQALSAWVAGG